jgi:hypothetical protein
VPPVDRGIVLTVNNRRNTNGGQFFITFAKTSWLNGKNVAEMFLTFINVQSFPEIPTASTPYRFKTEIIDPLTLSESSRSTIPTVSLSVTLTQFLDFSLEPGFRSPRLWRNRRRDFWPILCRHIQECL